MRPETMRPQDATQAPPTWPPVARGPGRQPSPPPQQRAFRPGETIPSARAAEAAKVRKSVALSRASFLLTGFCVLLSVCALPIWDAYILLDNANYQMWGNRTWPITVIAFSGGIIVMFLFVTTACGFGTRENNASQTLLQTTSMFLTLLGIMMALVSFPLSMNALTTWNDLSYNCLSHARAREVHDEYETLLRLRMEPTCQAQFTIEACEGFHESSTTGYLKTLENSFHCGGFCRDFSGIALAEASASVAAAPVPKSSLLRRRRGGETSVLQQDRHIKSEEALHDGMVGARSSATSASTALPALFHNGNVTRTCEKVVARDFSLLSDGIAWNSWASGFVLIIVSLLVVLWDWTTTKPK